MSQEVVIREELDLKVAKAENIFYSYRALKNIFGRTLVEDVVVGNQTSEKGSLVDKDIAMAQRGFE